MIKLLGYIFLFYIGFYYWRLAQDYKRNKWLFGFLGIATYFIGVFLYVLYIKYSLGNNLDEYSFTLISFKSIVSGFILTFVVFQVLDFIWKKKKNMNKEDIDNIGK